MNAKWEKPQAVSNLDMGFGVKKMNEFLPAWEEIPDQFKGEWGEVVKWTLMRLHMKRKR